MPKFRAKPREIWRNFETTFRLRAHTLGLEGFLLPTQKLTFLECLEDSAARAHTLCGETSDAFNNTPDLNAYINEV